jgi:hypothetical protein
VVASRWRLIDTAERDGHDVKHLLDEVAQQRDLGDAESIAAVLHYRVTHTIEQRTPEHAVDDELDTADMDQADTARTQDRQAEAAQQDAATDQTDAEHVDEREPDQQGATTSADHADEWQQLLDDANRVGQEIRETAERIRQRGVDADEAIEQAVDQVDNTKAETKPAATVTWPDNVPTLVMAMIDKVFVDAYGLGRGTGQLPRRTQRPPWPPVPSPPGPER